MNLTKAKSLIISALTLMVGGSIAGAAEGTSISGLEVNSAAFTNIGKVLSTLMSAAIIVSGIAAFIFLILGGFQYLTSGGDKAAAQSARDRITYAIMGLAIVAAAVAIIQVLGAVFGFNITGDIKWPGPTSTIGA